VIHPSKKVPSPVWLLSPPTPNTIALGGCEGLPLGRVGDESGDFGEQRGTVVADEAGVACGDGLSTLSGVLEY